MPENCQIFIRVVGVLVLLFIIIAAASFFQESRAASLLYQKKRDDRSSAYIQLQNILKKIEGYEKLKTEALEFFIVLEVLGAPDEISTKIALARLAQNADTHLPVDKKLSNIDLVQDPIQYVEAQDEPSAIQKWFASSALALKCVKYKQIKSLSRQFPRVASYWSRYVAHVDNAQVQAKWPVVGMDRCANANKQPSARLRALAKRHALRLQAIMHPPQEEIVIQIKPGTDLIHARMPIDPSEWARKTSGVGVEDLLVVRRQMNMGMPPLPLSALNLYKNTCACGYDFQAKPIIKLDAVPSSMLESPSLQRSITSDRIFGSANFSVQHHVYEIISHGCSKVFLSDSGKDELQSLCDSIINELSLVVGTMLGRADPNTSVYKHTTDLPAKETAQLTDSPYGECGFLSVVGGDLRVSCWRGFTRYDFGDDADIIDPSYHWAVVTAGELLAFATAKNDIKCYACVYNCACDRGREGFWYSARPSLAWSHRGYSFQNILVNSSLGRPYTMQPFQ